MATTFTLIESQTLAATATTVTFSSIPSTYTDLLFKVNVRSTVSGSLLGTNFTLNGDTGTNYSYTELYASGTGSATASRTSNATAIGFAVEGTTMAANTFTSAEIYIPNYTKTGAYKQFRYTYNTEDTTATSYVDTVACLYRGTSAISSISLGTTLSLAAGSSFYLYGIKNA